MAQTILFKKVPLLSDLPRNELDNLASTRQIVTLQAGNLQPAYGTLKRYRADASQSIDNALLTIHSVKRG